MSATVENFLLDTELSLQEVLEHFRQIYDAEEQIMYDRGGYFFQDERLIISSRPLTNTPFAKGVYQSLFKISPTVRIIFYYRKYRDDEVDSRKYLIKAMLQFLAQYPTTASYSVNDDGPAFWYINRQLYLHEPHSWLPAFWTSDLLAVIDIPYTFVDQPPE